MKILDLALNGLIIVPAGLFFAYVGYYYYDFGVFTTLPESIRSFFLSNISLQYIALVVAVSALAAKITVRRQIKLQETDNPDTRA